MAENASFSKRQKLNNSVLENNSADRHNLLLDFGDSIETLKESCSRSFCLLNFELCDAAWCGSFSQAKIKVKRSTDDEVRGEIVYANKTVYSFSSIFDRGFQSLMSYMKNPKDLPDSRGERLAIEKLFTFIQNIEKCEKALSAGLSCEGSTEWSLRLVHHLLTQLAVNPSYIVDNESQITRSVCSCCNERISGEYGDTSIGNQDVWHGSMDILMGPRNIVVTIAKEKDTDHSASKAPYFEKKLAQDLRNSRGQIIAQTVAFSFLQKKSNPEYSNFLIPTISFSKTDVLFFFYDCEHDILLESAPFGLFLTPSSKKLSLPTVLSLWLTLNYKYFCTGITTGMKDSGFVADFFKHAGSKIEHYVNGLRFGCGSNSESQESFFKPNPGDGWLVDDSEPLEA